MEKDDILKAIDEKYDRLGENENVPRRFIVFQAR